MAELMVITGDGKKADSGLKVSDVTFGADFNEPLVHQIVVAYQAGGRSGSSSQKSRSEVRGGGGKPWRQKGTGRSRAGTSRSPLWRGGGRVFPAQNRNFSQRVNRKMYRAALRAILSELNRRSRIWVCDNLSVTTPKTKELADKLKTFGVENVLIVQESVDKNLLRSARNLHRVSVCNVYQLNPISLFGHEQVVMTSGAVKQIEKWLQ